MTEIAELLTANLHRVFGNRDPESRSAAIRELFTDDAVFSDSEETLVGWDALDGKTAALLADIPAEVDFAEDGPLYIGEGFGAVPWRLGPADEPMVRGVDVITVRDGRIAELRTALAQ